MAPPECEVLVIDQIGSHLKEENPELPIMPSDPALLVYTSGSTGQHKGVIHSHRGLLHDVQVKVDLMKISSSDKLSLLAWGTGQAIKVVFSALLTGATLKPFNLKREGIGHLAEWMIEEKITIHTLSAPICRSFLELLKGDEEFKDLRVLRTASDAIYPKDLLRMKSHFGPQCHFINALASNETGTICANVMNQESTVDKTRVPVGYANNDCSISLLDENGKQLPPGQIGSIAITSRYIAKGYWRQPLLTEQTFFKDPDDPDLVTFRSADLGRIRDDGALELLGRNDFQVKIRGYRVDTMEVEAALLEHDNIAEAVVHAYEPTPGEKRLTGYIVPSSLSDF
jgi:acyl-coenzyme A synthetase/AMP-(fatty) acid ligase